MRRRTLRIEGIRRLSSTATKRLTALRVLGLTAAVAAATSCNSALPARPTQPDATLGDDIYGVFCDRLGASSFAEDLSGASYSAICHYDAKGNYGDTVDVSALPPPTTPAETAARKLSVAKLERLAQRRGDVVRALNATFPDVMIPDITSTTPGAQVGLHTALMDFAQSLTPLYESNPIVAGGPPLMPSQTQAMGRLFGSLGASGTCSAASTKACSYDSDCGTGSTCVNPVRDALSHMWGRRGYRPFQVGLGAVRPALAYPNLRTLTTSAISLVAPGGSAATELQQVLGVLQQEMVTATPTKPPLGYLTIDAATDQPSRPRSALEFTKALFLAQDPAFSTGTPSMFIAQRDLRGLVVPAGNTPGLVGTVPAPFVDLNNDGYADVDAFGRFVDMNGAALPLDPPFAIPEETTAAVDTFGRPTTSATTFAYLDTSKALVGGLTSSLLPLVDPTVQTTPGDPNGWQKENETLMYALSGAYLLYGNRVAATYDYGTEGPGGTSVSYSGFNAAASPLPDLVHAAGQVLADQDSDAILLSMLDLLQNHEATVARLMGAALNLRAIAAQHDVLAAGGTEPSASLAYTVPIWDEMAQVLSDITKKPGLMAALLGAMADQAVVTPVTSPYGPTTQHMGDALSKLSSFRDQLSYNKQGTHYDGSAHNSGYSGGINGPAVNLTVDPTGNDFSDPKTPIDNTMPRTGTNISCLQRSLQLIADANGGPACNKAGATVASKIGGITLSWPVTGFPLYASPYAACDLFQFNNLGMFYLDSLLPSSHPKRSELNIKASDLNALMSFLGVFVSEDTLLQESSDITGLTQYPEPSALNRLVWFGGSTNNPSYQGMPDADTVNQGTQTDNFVSGSIDPISSAWCPPDPSTMVPTCSTTAGTLRVRDLDSIFLWERFGFTSYLEPVIRALADGGTMGSCNATETTCDLTDLSGEQIFMDLSVILNRHWPAANHGAECQSTSSTMPIYCDGAGVNNYEPILADSFASDIIPALNEFATVATELSKITVQRGPSAGQTWTGAQVMEKLTKILFDQDYDKQVGLVDRQGNAAATWVDGTPQAQVTVFNLFADGLHKIDTSFQTACQNAGTNMAACLADATVRQGQWKRARSQLVDEFLTVDGTGTAAAFHNPTTTPTLITVLKLVREQLNANCPAREGQTDGTGCDWARSGLDTKLAGVLGRPLFASVVDLSDKLRQDETSRRQLETFLQYVLTSSNGSGQDLQATLASVADILQVLLDDTDLSPILDSGAIGVSPDATPAGPGAASVALQVLKALTSDTYDRYHVVDNILPNVVTPMDSGTNVSPIEILMDVIADVNRIDASNTSAFAPDDYEAIMGTMNSFMVDKTRGMEQLYTIIQNRPKQ